MKYAMAVWIIATIITVLAVWYRDHKYPTLIPYLSWKNSWPHQVALVSFFITITGLVVMLWLYFKDQF